MAVMALNITFVIIPIFFWYLKSGGYYSPGISGAMKEEILLKGQTMVLALMIILNWSTPTTTVRIGTPSSKWAFSKISGSTGRSSLL